MKNGNILDKLYVFVIKVWMLPLLYKEEEIMEPHNDLLRPTRPNTIQVKDKTPYPSLD